MHRAGLYSGHAYQRTQLVVLAQQTSYYDTSVTTLVQTSFVFFVKQYPELPTMQAVLHISAGGP